MLMLIYTVIILLTMHASIYSMQTLYPAELVAECIAIDAVCRLFLVADLNQFQLHIGHTTVLVKPVYKVLCVTILLEYFATIFCLSILYWNI